MPRIRPGTGLLDAKQESNLLCHVTPISINANLNKKRAKGQVMQCHKNNRSVYCLIQISTDAYNFIIKAPCGYWLQNVRLSACLVIKKLRVRQVLDFVLFFLCLFFSKCNATDFYIKRFLVIKLGTDSAYYVRNQPKQNYLGSRSQTSPKIGHLHKR